MHRKRPRDWPQSLDGIKTQKLDVLRREMNKLEALREARKCDTDNSNTRALQIEMCTRIVENVDKLDLTVLVRLVHSAYGSLSETAQPPQECKLSSPFQCPTCGTERTYDTVESQLSCYNCGLTIHFPETLEGRHGAVTSRNTSSSPGGYDRSALYRKHLEQYTLFSSDIPTDVLDVVKRNLLSMHVMHPSKCKPATIAKLLKHAKLHSWSKHAVRICRQICGQQSGGLTPEIINGLVARFEVVSRVYQKHNTLKCKFLNFDFLTKQFLYMDGMPRHAALFPFHKTRDVEERAEARLSRICDLVQQETDSCGNWFVTSADMAWARHGPLAGGHLSH